MRFLWYVITLFFMQMAVAASQTELDARFQETIDQFRAANKITSVTLTINYPDTALPKHFTSGTLSQESNEPVNENHLFQVGSITKSFIATLILKLQSAGYLVLDNPLSTYLPEYPEWGDITVRQLLNHTSGIYNFTDAIALRTFLFTHPQDYIDPNTLVDFAQQEPLYFKPGMGWHYSNTNYILLGKIIERVQGKPLDQVLEKYLQETIYLHNTFFIKHFYREGILRRMLHGYYQIDTASSLDITEYSMSWLNSAGGLVSNGNDLTQWLRSLFNGKTLNQDELNELQKLVSIETGQPITSVNELVPNGYGLGIRAWQSPWKSIDVIWWHSGGTIGYKSLMMWLPKQQIAIAIAYTQVVAGKEAVAFDPTTPLAQSILTLIASSL